MVLLASLLPVYAYAQQGDEGTPNFIFVNYIGSEVILDLDDFTYMIPGTATAPQGGRLELWLAPGEHKYAAQSPGVGLGSSGTFVIEPGGYVGKAARLDKTPAALDRNGIVLEKPRDYVNVFDFDPMAAPVAATPAPDVWQPTVAAPGQGSLAWTNFIGDELTVDLNGQLYRVPPAANNLPGRLQINLEPGLYRYTASVPYGSLNGEFSLAAGQVTGLDISAKLQPEPDYDVGEPSPLPRKVDLLLTQRDLTAQAIPAAVPDPAELPTSGEVVTPVGQPGDAAFTGVVIKNFAGETLIFTINNQAYLAPTNVETRLPLPPGRYNYTASLPFVATTGTVEVTDGLAVGLSVAINLGRDLLSVYQN
jgi:hypothetical protein